MHRIDKSITLPKNLYGVPFENMTAKERLKVSAYMVEATDSEQATLWSKYFQELNWQQLDSEIVCIGYLYGNAKKPLLLKLTWARFQTINVCFYDSSTFKYIDFSAIQEWIDTHFNGPRCSAHNFKDCIFVINSMVKIRKPVI